MSDYSHVVAIVGGAVSGSVAADVFAQRGIRAVVIEQNPRPYGKIEDGLPRWHSKQRVNEYARIDKLLDQDLVDYIPSTSLGRDINFKELCSWGFSAILLANGAWRDRPLGIEGIDRFVGRGLVYQNPFIYWFNHYPEADYAGPRYKVQEGAIVVGGGLASIDTVKALMLETVGARLRERGIEVDAYHMEHVGIDAVLAEHGLDFVSLGVEPCTLYYRRRASDMPTAHFRPGFSEAQKDKVRNVRKKILANAMRKFGFRFEELAVAVEAVVEDGALAGLRFQRTEIVEGRVVPKKGTEFEARASMILSSIGSIPEPIQGLPSQGELYDWTDREHGVLNHPAQVFGLGNVVTGQGNILVSRKHSKRIAGELAERFAAGDLGAVCDSVAEARAAEAEAIAHNIAQSSAPSRDCLHSLRERVAALQERVGYEGNYRSWIDKVSPPDPA